MSSITDYLFVFKEIAKTLAVIFLIMAFSICVLFYTNAIFSHPKEENRQENADLPFFVLANNSAFYDLGYNKENNYFFDKSGKQFKFHGNYTVISKIPEAIKEID